MSEHSSAAGQTCTISLELNGERRELQVQPWTTLLDLLRDQLGLTGTKKAAITASAAPARCCSTGGASTVA